MPKITTLYAFFSKEKVISNSDFTAEDLEKIVAKKLSSLYEEMKTRFPTLDDILSSANNNKRLGQLEDLKIYHYSEEVLWITLSFYLGLGTFYEMSKLEKPLSKKSIESSFGKSNRKLEGSLRYFALEVLSENGQPHRNVTEDAIKKKDDEVSKLASGILELATGNLEAAKELCSRCGLDGEAFVKRLEGFKKQNTTQQAPKFRVCPDLTTEEKSEGEDVSDLLLTVRIMNGLRQANIYTVPQLTSYTEKELLEIPGIGKGNLEEIKTVLKAKGLFLRPEA